MDNLGHLIIDFIENQLCLIYFGGYLKLPETKEIDFRLLLLEPCLEEFPKIPKNTLIRFINLMLNFNKDYLFRTSYFFLSDDHKLDFDKSNKDMPFRIIKN